METNKIYVAIGKEVEERESILRWVLKNFPGKTIFVIYVHVPANRILPSDLKLPVRFVSKNEFEAYRAQERENMRRLLDECCQMCTKFQVPCESIFVERDTITEGILELINQLRIEKLVMAASSANNIYWRSVGTEKLMSEKVENVLQSAPDFCHIWLICNDRMIYKREGVMRQNPHVEEMPSSSSKFNNHHLGSPSPSENHLNDNLYSNLGKSSWRDAFRKSVSWWNAEKQASEAIRQAKPGERLYYEELRLKVMKEERFAEVSFELSEALNQKLLFEREIEKFNFKVMDLEERLVLEEEYSQKYKNERDKLQIERNAAVEENEKSNLTVKDLEGNLMARVELSQKYQYERDKLQIEKDGAVKENEKSNLKVKDWEGNLMSGVKLSHRYRNECDKLRIERDGAVKEGQELREQLDLGCSSSNNFMFSEFSNLELQKATNYFDPSLKIGEGSYGTMYIGFLHHTEVAIKLLDSTCLRNQGEFDEQVSCISKLRHPNLVTLMGACREPWALVYEYLPGGPLIDRLKNTPPLPWQMRIRIAMDICSALIFLHSSNPTCITKGDLTPLKLLLDANFTCKITDFGVTANSTTSMNLITTRFFKPKPEPDNMKPGDVESDIYSFGIIVLQLLTGNPVAYGIVMTVKFALSDGTLDRILDPLAGDWPFVQAEQLAHMAIRCCDLNSNKRPDLCSDVWRVLAPMRGSCSSLSLLSVASHDQPPHFFTCPILQEIMEDPQFAADGFTYEAEAIRGWFESGHDTSPMTNMKLTSCDLTPNRALRSVIQEWLQLKSTK